VRKDYKELLAELLLDLTIGRRRSVAARSPDPLAKPPGIETVSLIVSLLAFTTITSDRF
jgi:hypothetical protein